VGRGPGKPEDSDRDEGQGEDSDHDKSQFHDSPSRPESSNVSFEDPSQGMKLQSVNGARSVTYSGACVTLVGDALVNGAAGNRDRQPVGCRHRANRRRLPEKHSPDLWVRVHSSTLTLAIRKRAPTGPFFHSSQKLLG
jgi:hypothetical protein